MLLSSFSLRTFVKHAVTENLGLKLLALLIAFSLIVLFRAQEDSERLVDFDVVPLQQTSGRGLVMTSALPDTVKVRVRGPRSAVEAIEESQLKPVELDLRDPKAGSSTIYLNKELFELPLTVKFVRVTPESLQVRFERTVSRSLPVRVRTIGRLANGVEMVGDPIVEPGEVMVMGAASLIRGLADMETDEIDVESLGVGEHAFEALIRHVEGVDVRGEETLAVRVNVRWIPGQRLISGLLVRVEGTELNPLAIPDEVAVALKGPQVALDKLDPSALMPVVVFEEDDVGPGVYRRQVSMRGLPELITVASIVPNKIRVRLNETVDRPKGSK